MRVVVTGATGTVGGAVLRRLLADGHEAVAAVRRLGPLASPTPPPRSTSTSPTPPRTAPRFAAPAASS